METGVDLSTRLKLGLWAQGFSQGVQVLLRLVEVPLLLVVWGPQLYGEWLMIAAIPVYFALTDGGFSGAAVREMGMRSAGGDRGGAVAVFQSTSALLLGVASAVILLTALGVQKLPLDILLGFKAIRADAASTLLILLVVHVFINSFGYLLYGGFWCSGKYPLGMALVALTQLVEFGGLVIGAAVWGGVVEAATGFLAGRVLGTVIIWCALLRATPWLRFGLRDASLTEIKKLASPALASLAFPLGNALNLQGMRLVAGLVLGPAYVAVFSTIRTLARLIALPSSIVNGLMQPEMGVAHGRGDTALLSQLFVRSCQVSFWMCLIGGIPLLMGGDKVLSIWTAGNVEMQWPLFLALLGAVAVNAVWYTALMVPYATNRYGQIALVYCAVYGGATFLFAHVGARTLGLNGLGLALLVTEILMAWYVIALSLRLCTTSWKEWFLSVTSRPMWLAETLHVSRTARRFRGK